MASLRRAPSVPLLGRLLLSLELLHFAMILVCYYVPPPVDETISLDSNARTTFSRYTSLATHHFVSFCSLLSGATDSGAAVVVRLSAEGKGYWEFSNIGKGAHTAHRKCETRVEWGLRRYDITVDVLAPSASGVERVVLVRLVPAHRTDLAMDIYVLGLPFWLAVAIYYLVGRWRLRPLGTVRPVGAQERQQRSEPGEERRRPRSGVRE
jgi:hypothetical protein